MIGFFRITMPLTLLAVLAAPPAAAAEIEEVVVTAQRRAQSVQDVPIAMAAYTGEQLEELGLKDLRELIEYVPGIELYDDRANSSQPTWIIRGVGLADFNSNNTPTAAIYYDDFYLTSNAMGGIGMFDIERVEVLKGPQGGLYGRNTTGGAVRVESVKPSLEESDGYVQASYGRWDRVNVEGAFGTQLSDRAALRIAAMTNQGGGWQDTLATPGDDDWGDSDFFAVRAQLLVQPTDEVSFLLKVEGGRDQSETLLGHSVGAYDPLTGDYCAAVLGGGRDDNTCISWANLTNLFNGADIGPLPSDQSDNGKVVTANPINELDNEWISASLRVDVDMQGFTLTSITGYIDYSTEQVWDYDGSFLDAGHEYNDSPIEAWSQEFRLVSSDDGAAFNWQVGISYSEDELNEFRSFTFSDNLLIFGGLPSSDRGFDQETEAWSVYGEVSYAVNDSVQVHGSLRYTDEEKTLRDGFTTLNVEPGDPGKTLGVPLAVFIEDVDKDYELDEQWAGHVGIDWTPGDNTLVYGRVTRGFKSGGFFGGFALSDEELDPYLEETVWAYEVGIKTDLAERTLRVNAAAFYYDYQDVTGFTSVFSAVTQTALTKLDNIGDATHKGFELDVVWLPRGVDGLSFNAGLAWLDAELDSSATFLAQDFVTDVSYDGLERPYAPDFSYFVQGRYEWAVGDGLSAMIQVSYSWRDDLVHDDVSGHPVDAGLFALDDYGLLNARVQVGSADRRWSVALVGRNLTDEEYLANTTFDNLGSYLYTYGQPVSYAAEFSYNW